VKNLGLAANRRFFAPLRMTRKGPLMTSAPMPFALALGTVSFFLAVVWGPPLIRLLRKWRIGKKIRVEEPSYHHETKMGTPTMGGLMILVPVLAITIVLNLANFLSGFDAGKAILAFFNFQEGSSLIGKSILLPLLALLAFGTLGAIDDLSETRGWFGGGGLRARTMFPLQRWRRCRSPSRCGTLVSWTCTR